MEVIEIQHIDDPRIALYRNIKDRELAEQGDRFMAEGELVVRRMLAGGVKVDSVLLDREKWPQFSEHVPKGVTVYLAQPGILESIIGYKFHSGALGIGIRPPALGLNQLRNLWESNPDQRYTLLVAPDIINHDNVGALLRIGAGLGADGMLFGQRSCDPYWRRSIRVSMGAIFKLPVARSTDIITDLKTLRSEHGFTLLGAVLDDSAVPLPQVRRPFQTGKPDRVALLVGNEAQGLSRTIISLCDVKITIPMHQGTDSLNVAVATAICLYQLAQR